MDTKATHHPDYDPSWAEPWSPWHLTYGPWLTAEPDDGRLNGMSENYKPKSSSALPVNRRVRSVAPTVSGHRPLLYRYERGVLKGTMFRIDGD